MSYNWRNHYFDDEFCKGIMSESQNGNITVKGSLKNNIKDVKINYWAF